MFYDFLKNIAENNDWKFEYSRSDYQNLYDGMENNKVHLFADPIQIDSKFSDSGFETFTYSGQFMLLLSSDLDETYTEKYINNIRPLIEQTINIIKEEIQCSNLEILKFSTLEAINIFDQNLDGLVVTYSVFNNN